MEQRKHYHFHVIELSKDVLFEARFRKANRYVLHHGLRLLPELYELYGLLSYDESRDLEVELAIDLRESGYGVWQA